jgi:diacylglycerol kinase family enzyme
LSLLAGEHSAKSIDAIRVADRLFFLNLSVGVSALMMRDTERDAKRRFGRFAYVWTGLTRLLGIQPHRFTVVVDGQVTCLRASEVVVANSGALGEPSLRWGPQVRLNDVRLDVCIVRAWTAADYLRVAWNVLRRRQDRDPNLRFLRAERSVTISARRPLPMQGDGEFLGWTPVHVEVLPSAVRVIVPMVSGRGKDVD